jgi:hypothetical protein
MISSTLAGQRTTASHLLQQVRKDSGVIEVLWPVPIVVEVNLKVPSLTVRTPDKPDRKVDNSSVRFSKRVTVESIPKAGEWLQLSTQGDSFECTVIRADWNEGKNLFVVACTLSRRSITPAELEAFLTDPEWATTQLP